MELEQITFSQAEEIFPLYLGGDLYWDHHDSQNRFQSVGGKILHIALTPSGVEMKCESILMMEDETPSYHQENVITIYHDRIRGWWLGDDGSLRLTEDFGDIFFYRYDGKENVLMKRWVDRMIHGNPTW